MDQDPLKTSGGFKHCLFSSLFGEDSHSDEYFSKWVEPTNYIDQIRHCLCLEDDPRY